MIILNSLKSITVITATVVLSYFIWNKIVAWEKTAKCGAPDFSHFTEMGLKWKLCPAPEVPVSSRGTGPCDSDDELWNGVNSAQGQGCSKNSSAQNPLSHSLPHPPAQGQQDTLSHHCRQTLIPNPQNPSGEKLLHPQDVFRSLLGLKQSLNKENIIIQGEAQLHPDGTIYLSYKDRYILHGLLFLRAHTQAIFSLQWGCPNKSLTGKQ